MNCRFLARSRLALLGCERLGMTNGGALLGHERVEMNKEIGKGDWVMSLGVVVGDLMGVADGGSFWGEAEPSGRRGRGRKLGRRGDGVADKSVRSTLPCTTLDRSSRAVTGKRLGEVAEAAFMAKASALGFGVSKTWGDSDRYDFIVDGGAGLWRVQVKSAHRAGEDGGYSFRSHGHSQDAYRAEEIDALVAYVVPEDAWYVFPAAVFVGMKSMKLFGGSRRRRSKFERYREAWEILRERR